MGAMKWKRSWLPRMMSSLFSRSSRSIRLPSSRAASTVTALAMPMPLYLSVRSFTSRRARSVSLLPFCWRMSLAKSMALVPCIPVRNNMAISSLSVRLFLPWESIFSRGRSSGAHWVMGMVLMGVVSVLFAMLFYFFAKIHLFFGKML